MDMPLYEYKCLKCGEKFELLRRINDDDSNVKCPKCGSSEVKREVSGFASIGGSSSSGVSCGSGRFS